MAGAVECVHHEGLGGKGMRKYGLTGPKVWMASRENCGGHVRALSGLRFITRIIGRHCG
jgi:hypothetical protein